MWRHFQAQQEAIFAYKTGQTQQKLHIKPTENITTKEYKHLNLYTKTKKQHVSLHRNERSGDKTPSKIQKQGLATTSATISHIITFCRCVTAQLWYLGPIKSQPRETKYERVCCYCRFYRVFHSGCRLSAVAVTALSRLIIQNPLLLNDNHHFGADYSTAFCLF
ncbi:hypothetical protein AERO9A_320116 [Aeromonas salmonicida]|nr:hypothetical protein AERO9A_320116 [Aeromonas salmonicida]